MTNKLKVADLYCGAGGSSTGLLNKAGELGIAVDLTAVNHWETAIETHSQNHPGVRHICGELDSLNPRKIIGRHLDLLWASPECTYHSKARAGKPVDDQRRATAWCVVRWAEALKPKHILCENVSEWQGWAPLLPNGKPDPKKHGQIFRAWVGCLRAMGYAIDYRVLNCADYGDATVRKRLFLQATLGGRPILSDGAASEDSIGLQYVWSGRADVGAL